MVGFKEKVKEKFDNYIQEQQKISKEQKEYNKQLKEDIDKIRKDEFRKEALKSARKKAKKDAKEKFNSTNQSYLDYNFINSLGEGKLQKKKNKTELLSMNDLLYKY